MTPPLKEDPNSPLNMLRQLFDDTRMSNLKRGKGWAEKRQPRAMMKARRKAIKTSWAKAQAERHTKVAGYNACHQWFPDFGTRYRHDCPGKVAA